LIGPTDFVILLEKPHTDSKRGRDCFFPVQRTKNAKSLPAKIGSSEHVQEIAVPLLGKDLKRLKRKAAQKSSTRSGPFDRSVHAAREKQCGVFEAAYCRGSGGKAHSEKKPQRGTWWATQIARRRVGEGLCTSKPIVLKGGKGKGSFFAGYGDVQTRASKEKGQGVSKKTETTFKNKMGGLEKKVPGLRSVQGRPTKELARGGSQTRGAGSPKIT